jgi:hypothetical protein
MRCLFFVVVFQGLCVPAEGQSWPPQTLSAKFANCDATLWVQWDGKFDADERPMVRVLDSFGKGDAARPARGSLIGLWPHKPQGRKFLVGGRRSKTAGQEGWIWDRKHPATKTVFDYVKAAPDANLEPVQRAIYFARFLESDDKTVAIDAWQELHRMPLEVLFNAPKLGLRRIDLRTWLASESIPDQRKGTYALLLAGFGKAADKPLLFSLVEHRSPDYRLGLEQMMAAYLTLAAKPGLDQISKLVIQPKMSKDSSGDLIEVVFSEKYAAVQAIRRLLKLSEPPIPKSDLMAALYPLLKNDLLADLVIPDLVRQKDWSQMKLIGERIENTETPRIIKLGAVKYLLHFVNAESADKQQQMKAEALLKEIAKTQPSIYKSAKRTMIVLPAAEK